MDARQQLIDALKKDLIGPQGSVDELIENRPSDQYLTGILFPLSSPKDPGDEEARQERDEDQDGAGESEGSPGESISMQSIRRPNSLGISFGVRGASNPKLKVTATAAAYTRFAIREGALVQVESLSEAERGSERWQRRAISIEREFPVVEGLRSFQDTVAPGLRWYVRGHRSGDSDWLVTVVLSNENEPLPGRAYMEEACFFQVAFHVGLAAGEFSGRRARQSGSDEDGRVSNLIYRNVKEWAVGHTCSATWDGSPPSTVGTCWTPAEHVLSMSADGDPIFMTVAAEVGGDQNPFDAAVLFSEQDTDRLRALLEVIPRAYSIWLDQQERDTQQLRSSGTLDAEQSETASLNIARARIACARIRAGIELIVEKPLVRQAFQLSQRAMLMQRQWTVKSSKATLIWRPFQLGFFLQTLAGLAAPSDANGVATEDRLTMDLLWFPTGGGKTEAYLALTAFTLFHRRLSSGANPDAGAGVAVLMRYTLRLLTVQQFERCARLILACERIRQEGRGTLGQVPFSIGLWVGGDATPNKVAETLDPEKDKRARQLAACPACAAETLQWVRKDQDYTVACQNGGCFFHKQFLPIATIDEIVYRMRPSLLIGTVDKFTQIVRNENTIGFFSPEPQAPDLIIQDELHLISGPLGTLAGAYETAIDALCTKKGIPPKVVGSTATIRRAGQQVRALFAREVAQFPPPVLDASNSGFAVTDANLPGRIYIGFSSAGRSPKFLLQGSCASLLQGVAELPAEARDPYWTLIAYFNSLRELGGALVMMYDDVPQSMQLYSKCHGTQQRDAQVIQELTSRIDSGEIPLVLNRLATRYPEQTTDVVLATNMLSVGVDVPRLGLMAVNGQPKSMSEYIQATSRVGRNAVSGLVVTCYNAGRPRDRSHFESFRTWHQALYREVEATSVTPFAPRARDRALHAPLVAMVRHRIDSLRQVPKPVSIDMFENIIATITTRVTQVDPDVAADATAELRRFCMQWVQRQSQLKKYWNDHQTDQSLLVSAERAATVRAQRGAWTGAAQPTPNSLRDVEASSVCTLRPRSQGSV